MHFDTPEDVLSIIQSLKDADATGSPMSRAQGRKILVDLYNGAPTYTAEECRENNIDCNVNFKQGTMAMLAANQEGESALLTSANFFRISVPDAPQSKKSQYGGELTRLANRVYKKSRPFLHTMRQEIASVNLFGIGPKMWSDQYDPIPFFVPVADLLIPTDTLVTLENLPHFAVRREMVPGQLFRKTIAKGKNMDPGWNLDMVRQILAALKQEDQNTDNVNYFEQPERLAELYKQNQCFYDSDAVPKVRFFDFYYQHEDEARACWYKCIILDTDQGLVTREGGDIAEGGFVYQKEEPYAESIDQLIHIRYGDGNINPPFRHHATRGLGWILSDLIHLMNRMQCTFTQKVFQDLIDLFRCQDPGDHSRLDQIYIGLTRAIFPDGLSFVKNEERHEVNEQLIQTWLGNSRQLLSEGTAAYNQDIDDGTKKERTAFEVQALMSNLGKITGAMRNLNYEQTKYGYMENCRRLALKNTPDWTAKKFRSDAIATGVPDKWIDSERWEIEVERVLGQGNMMMGQAQAKALYDIRADLNPTGQAIVRNEYVYQVTQDPARAEAIAPRDGAPHVTNTIHDTELVFNAFMTGTPVTPVPGNNPIEVIETILKLMTGVIEAVMQGGGVGSPQQAHGLDGAAMYASYYIQEMSKDKAQKERVTDYGKKLGKLMNFVKAMHQRQQQAADAAQKQQGNGHDPETMAKVQGMMAQTAAKIKGKEASETQKLKHKETAFALEQRRKNLDALGKVQRDTMQATVEAHAKARQAAQKPKKIMGEE